MKIKQNNFEDIIGYTFVDKSLLREALTHSSYFHENKNVKFYNERIEFLGDAILGLIVSDYLFKNYPLIDEGELSKMKASLVCEGSLAKGANSIKLGKFLLLGKGEELNGGRFRESILADACEAVIGAIYLDSNLDTVKSFVCRFIIQNSLDYMEHGGNDYKTLLQESIQKFSTMPIEYRILSEDGPEHSKIFLASVSHDGKVMGKGEGKTKKEAEQKAAFNAINFLKDNK